MLLVYFKLGSNLQVGLPQGLHTVRACSYHIRINKRRVALKKQIFSKPHENDAKISSRETALIAPRHLWEQ